MMLRPDNVLCPLVLAAYIAVQAMADQIYLKNGSVLDGLIKEETKTHVVLDFGVGSTTIDRAQIRAIRRTGAQANEQLKDKWKKKYFLHKKNVPEGMEDIAAEFLGLSEKRNNAFRAQLALSSGKKNERSLREEIESLRENLVEVSRKLETASPEQDRKAYNALIVENNSIMARLTLKYEEVKGINEHRGTSAERIAGYLESLTAFESSFSQRLEAYSQGSENEGTRHFLDSISDGLQAFKTEFSDTVVPSTVIHGSTVVSALVNDRVQGRFILDTGAVLVTLSETFAKRLNLDTSESQTLELVLADGSKVKAKPVTLSSIEVADARTEDVPAAVLPASARKDVDGLLGMSFLGRFMIHMDGATGKLILKKFDPK